MTPPLIEKRLRSNPLYELFLGEQCVDHDDAPRPSSSSDESLYGYLRPKASAHLPIRVVSPDDALLFLTLRQAGLAPAYFRSLLCGRADNYLSRLILDGVLEVEHEGAFLSGPAASKALKHDHEYASQGLIAERSREALRYVEALGELTVTEMMIRLYGFGRCPASAACKRSFDRDGVHGFSGVLGPATHSLEKYWTLSSGGNIHWLMWHPIRRQGERERARFKLYVSPERSHAGSAFAASAEILGQTPGVRGLKLGRGLAGLTRPDKMVAYFSRLDDLQEAGVRLYRQLEGCPVHGVPFTAEQSPDGLLSWGADPPRTAPGQPESWRLWITRKLARHFETARSGDGYGPLWRFVLDRLRLDGVNPDTWVPEAEFWSTIAVDA